MAELEACCSQHYCTCKEKPGAPCGKDNGSLEVTVEVTSDTAENMEVTNKNDSGSAGVVETNLGSEKCSTPEQLCCICGKPIRGSSAPEPPVEESAPAGCGLEECDTEFCASQNFPCENMKEPAVADDGAADDDAAEASEAVETPESKEGSEKKSENSNPEPPEDANGEDETAPSDPAAETGEAHSCPCKSKKDPPPEE